LKLGPLANTRHVTDIILRVCFRIVTAAAGVLEDEGTIHPIGLRRLQAIIRRIAGIFTPFTETKTITEIIPRIQYRVIASGSCEHIGVATVLTIGNYGLHARARLFAGERNTFTSSFGVTAIIPRVGLSIITGVGILDEGTACSGITGIVRTGIAIDAIQGHLARAPAL